MTNRRQLLIGGAAILGTAVVGLVGLLRAWSPGEPAPLVDDDGRAIAGSLSERVFVDINGVPHGMIIQSADAANPVLLFLHGGPGMPEFFLNTTHPTGLYQRLFHVTCAQVLVVIDVTMAGSPSKRFHALQQASTIAS